MGCLMLTLKSAQVPVPSLILSSSAQLFLSPFLDISSWLFSLLSYRDGPEIDCDLCLLAQTLPSIQFISLSSNHFLTF